MFEIVFSMFDGLKSLLRLQSEATRINIVKARDVNLGAARSRKRG